MAAFTSKRLVTLTRRPAPARARVFFWLLLALLLAPYGGAAHAQGGELLVGVSPAPVAGSDAVRFISQAVDARLYRAEDGSYRVAAEGAVRLHNTDRFNVAAITLGWPGWGGGDTRFDPAALPPFAPRQGEQPLATRLETRPTSFDGQTRDTVWLVAEASIAPDSRERFLFEWNQPIGEGPLLTYSFGLLPASAWAGPVGSARVTLQLPGVVSEEVIIRAEPDSYTFTGDSIEWIWVEEEPGVNPSVTIIAPHLWGEIEAARAARASDPLNANLQLASLYDQLAGAGVALYGGEAEAALEAARQAAPEQPEPQRRLSELYRARAEQLGGDLALLEQAASYGEAALAAGVDDAALRESVLRDLETLAAAWADKDPSVALGFLGRGTALTDDRARFDANRQALAQRLALAALQRGESASAREIAAQYGLPTEVATLPWLSSVAVRVENVPGERTVRFFGTGEAGTLDERLAPLATGLTAAGTPTTWDAAAGTLTIQLRGGEAEWLSAGQSVAAALPPDPEWDVLRGVLVPQELLYRTVDDTFQRRYGYRERVQIAPRAAEIAVQLRDSVAARGTAWEQALVLDAAAQWQRLADSQDVSIVTRFDAGGALQRDWSLSLPAQETLEWRGETARRDRWLYLAGGGALALLLLLGLIWLPGRGRKTRIYRN